MPSAAKKAFDRNIQRAGYFLEIHMDATGGPGQPKRSLQELPRAAVVFAVGALDAYLSDVAAETLVERLQYGATSAQRDVLTKVSKDIPVLALEVALLPDQEGRIAHVLAAISAHFTRRPAHESKAVSQTVQLLDGHPVTVWDAVKAAGFPNGARDLDDWTEKRHKVIHRGESPRVNRTPAQKCVDLITTIVKMTEEEVQRASRSAQSGSP